MTRNKYTLLQHDAKLLKVQKQNFKNQYPAPGTAASQDIFRKVL